MLNYIWAGLIVFALVFALIIDSQDLSRNTYRNGKALPITIRAKADAPIADEGKTDVEVVIDSEVYRNHFGLHTAPNLAGSYPATVIATPQGKQVLFAKDAPFPEPMLTMRNFLGGDDKQLRGTVIKGDWFAMPSGSVITSLEFEKVRFVKVRDMTLAAFEFSKTAVTIAIGLIGILALWLGLMRIAEASGLVLIFVRIVQPILHPLFPQIPKGHPALGMLGLNLAANMLGLANAATPFGLKAMEEMQKLNPTDDTATDPMVMLMAINTAGVQLVPPATLVAVLGLEVTKVYIPILVVTGLATGISIVTCKIFERFPAYRRSNPNLNPPGRLVSARGGVA